MRSPREDVAGRAAGPARVSGGVGASRGAPWRAVAEWTAVAVAAGLLVAALLRAVAPSSVAPEQAVTTVTSDRPDGAAPSPVSLARTIMGLGGDTLRIAARDVPADTVRELLVAERRSGVPLCIAGAGGWPRTALAVAPRPRPFGGARVAVVHESVRTAAGGEADAGATTDAAGDTLHLADEAGPVDAVAVDGVAVGEVAAASAPSARVTSWSLAESPRTLTARLGGTTARRVLPAPPERPYRVLLAGSAGWEFRFVLAALEATGWTVDARVPVAPTARVTVGTPAPPTRERYDVVVALDAASLAAEVAPPGLSAGTLASFVRDGGGLVLLGDAADAPAVRALRAAVPGAPRPGLPGAVRGHTPLDGLTARTVADLAEGARPLARSARPDTAPLVVARRVGAGRVVQALPVETWSWRMLGDDGAVAAHAAWWDALVEAASPAVDADGAWAATATGTPSLQAPLPGDAAPWADLVARLGRDSAPRAAPADWPPPPPAAPPAWWGIVAVLLLAAAWGSRRLRGAP